MSAVRNVVANPAIATLVVASTLGRLQCKKEIFFSGFQAMGVGIFRIVSVHPAELRHL